MTESFTPVETADGSAVSPDSNLEDDLKLGRNYSAAIVSSADTLVPYLEQKAIISSLGLLR